MLKRTVSGAVFVAVVVGFFLLRENVDARLFQILTGFFQIVATVELALALKRFIGKARACVLFVYAGLFSPVYCLGEYLISGVSGVVLALCLTALFVLILSVLALVDKAGLKKWSLSIFGLVYPSLLILFTLLACDLKNSFTALLLIFVISPCCDTTAYLVGSAIGGKKLCPKLSPKKTWSGAIGGLFGAIIGSIVVYFAIRPVINFFSPVLFFVLVGLVAGVLTEVGDLFESFIKRKAGIKDSGNIMPGHGGILDRIDGMMFAGVFICLAFLLV